MNNGRIVLDSTVSSQYSTSYDSGVNTSSEGSEQRQYNSCWSEGLDGGLIVHDGQTLNDREVEQVVLRPDDREMLEKFSNHELSKEDDSAAKKLLQEIIGQDLADLDEEQLRGISKIIVKMPQKLNKIRKLLDYLVDIELLRILRDEKLTMTHVEKIFDSPQNEDILMGVTVYAKLFENETIVSCFDQIIGFSDPWRLITDCFGIRENAKILSCLRQILDSSDPLSKLSALKGHLDIVENEKITTDILAVIITSPRTGSILKLLKEYLEVLKHEKISSGVLEKMIILSNLSFILKLFKRYPKLLEDKAITTAHLEKILVYSKAPKQVAAILQHLGSNPNLLHEGITPELLEKTMTASCPISVLKFLKLYPVLLTNDRILACFEQIIAHPDSYNVLEVLGKYPCLLNNKTIMAILESILDSQWAFSLLETFGHCINLLENEKMTLEVVKQMIASPQSIKVIEELYFRRLLENEKMTLEFLIELFPSRYAGAILEAIGKYPNLFESEDFSINLMEKIFPLSTSQPILESIAKYPSLLAIFASKSCTSELLDKIFRVGRKDMILEALINCPSLLHIDTELWETILHCNIPHWVIGLAKDYAHVFKHKRFTKAYFEKIISHPRVYFIMEVLRLNLGLLSNVRPELWEIFFASPNPENALEVFRKSKNIQVMDLKLWRIALNSAEPVDALNALRKFPEIFKNEKFTPELLSLILGKVDIKHFEQILTYLSKYSQLLTGLEFDKLQKCFDLQDPQVELLKLGKKLAIDWLKSELTLKEENFELAEKLIDEMANPRMVKAFFKFGSKGLEYAKMYLEGNVETKQHLNITMAPYLIARLEQMESESKGPFINLTNIIKDSLAYLWNILAEEKEDINDVQWNDLGKDFKQKIEELFPNNQNLEEGKKVYKKWFRKVGQSRDAELDLQGLRKRVASVIQFFKEKMGGEDEDVEIAKKLFEILAEHGTACSDRAVVGLEKAELYAKAFTDKKGSTLGYRINLIVNEFKRNIILSQFVDPNQAEQLETAFYLFILLNKVFGLECSNQNMAHAGCAEKTPLDEAIKEMYPVLNDIDALIGFAEDHPLMESVFKKASNPKELAEFNDLIEDRELGLGVYSILVEKNSAIDPEDDSKLYIERIKFLINQASSIETFQALNDRFGVDYYSGMEISEEDTAILNSLKLELESIISTMANNFEKEKKQRTEKTKTLLTEANFLSTSTHYELIDDTYWTETAIKHDFEIDYLNNLNDGLDLENIDANLLVFEDEANVEEEDQNANPERAVEGENLGM